MKIKILKDGLINGDTGKPMKKGDVITVSKDRGEKAIKLERAEEVKTKKKSTKKSEQQKVEDKLEKK